MWARSSLKNRLGTTVAFRRPLGKPANDAPSIDVSDIGLTIHFQISKTRLRGEKAHRNLPDRSIAVLGEDNVSDILSVGVRVVQFLAVDEHDDIGILFDTSAFAEVAQHWAVILACLDRAAELAERDHRDIQFACQGLEAPGDL